MRVLIVGGAGLVGGGVVDLLARGEFKNLSPVTDLVIADRRPPLKEIVAPFPVRFLECDLRDTAQVEAAFAHKPQLVFHLAAIMSSTAERDYDFAWQVNVDGTRRVLDACRTLDERPRFVFVSSSAVYGEDLPATVPDDHPPRPKNAYGVQKLIGELMVLEYSRKGFIDGRIGRLAGIAIRPDDTHQGAAAFITQMVREPLMGRDVVCPVPYDTRVGIVTPRTAFAAILHLAEMPEDLIKDDRLTQIPALTVTAGEIVEGVRRVGGDKAASHIRLEIDDELVAIRKTIAASFAGDRGRARGFPIVENFDAVIAEFLDDSGLRETLRDR